MRRIKRTTLFCRSREILGRQPATSGARTLSGFAWCELPACARRHLGEATDTEIWEYAGRNDIVVISKDEDFLYLANTPSAKARLVWIRFGNCRKKALFSAVERLWPKIEVGLGAGERIIEVR